MSIPYFDESWTMPPGLTHRDFDPDDNPDHDDDDPRCACDDCDQIAREQEAEEQGDWRRDDEAVCND